MKFAGRSILYILKCPSSFHFASNGTRESTGKSRLSSAFPSLNKCDFLITELLFVQVNSLQLVQHALNLHMHVFFFLSLSLGRWHVKTKYPHMHRHRLNGNNWSSRKLILYQTYALQTVRHLQKAIPYLMTGSKYFLHCTFYNDTNLAISPAVNKRV